MTRPLHVTLQGRPLTLPIRRDRRARRITIHIDAAIGGARIVMPVNAVLTEAEAALDAARARAERMMRSTIASAIDWLLLSHCSSAGRWCSPCSAATGDRTVARNWTF